MRHLLQTARKDPQKTAGFSVLAILAIGSLVLYVAYLRRPAVPAIAYSLAPKPATRPTTQRSEELLADSQIIQQNSLQLERRRLALNEARAMRTLGRPGPGGPGGRRPPPPDARGTLERLFRPRAAAPAMLAPTTSPTTQASIR